MTQADLAHKLGVSTASVTYWIRGVKSPRMDKVDAMCKIFGCKRSDFMDDTPQPAAHTLSSEEEAHLASYRRLDQDDRLKVQGFVEGLLVQDKYTKRGAADFSA